MDKPKTKCIDCKNCVEKFNGFYVCKVAHSQEESMNLGQLYVEGFGGWCGDYIKKQ